MTVILAIAGVRLTRRSQLHSAGLVVAGLDLATQLLVILGLALVVSPDALTQGTDLGVSPTWDDLAFALPLAMLAYTGLETVANLAEETREPGRTLRAASSPRSARRLLTAAVAAVGLAAFPVENGETALGERVAEGAAGGHRRRARHAPPRPRRRRAPRLRRAHGRARPARRRDDVDLGLHRLAHSLGEHRQLPPSFGRLNRRTLVSPQAIVAAAVISIGLVVGTALVTDDVAFLASLYSFGVLLAFAAAQLA